MEESLIKRKSKVLKVDDNAPLKLWLISEIYGWTMVCIGFGIFLMLAIAAIAHLFDAGLSFDSLFSLLQLVEGITIGGGFIAFGTALRRLVIVQATLCIIFLLITIWFLYFFSIYSDWVNCLKSLGTGLVIIFPLALCVFLNRKSI